MKNVIPFPRGGHENTLDNSMEDSWIKCEVEILDNAKNVELNAGIETKKYKHK